MANNPQLLQMSIELHQLQKRMIHNINEPSTALFNSQISLTLSNTNNGKVYIYLFFILYSFYYSNLFAV